MLFKVDDVYKLKISTMKKLLFMMFLLGGVAVGFSSCGEEGADDAAEETTEEAADDSHDEGGH